MARAWLPLGPYLAAAHAGARLPSEQQVRGRRGVQRHRGLVQQHEALVVGVLQRRPQQQLRRHGQAGPAPVRLLAQIPSDISRMTWPGRALPSHHQGAGMSKTLSMTRMHD